MFTSQKPCESAMLHWADGGMAISWLCATSIRKGRAGSHKPRTRINPFQPPAASSRRAVEKPDGSHHQEPNQSTPPDSAPKTSRNAITGIPDHVLKTLVYVEKHHRAPDGYEGGRVFHNFGNGGEQALPRTDDDGKRITYHEWDVYPKRPGVNRGAIDW